MAIAIDKDRERAIEIAISPIERQFGKGSIMKMGDASAMQIESIPTGSIALDLALGIGGVPRGRITEIYGPESSGKTTLALHIIAEAQKMGGMAAYHRRRARARPDLRRAGWASISTSCSSPSPTPASRRSRSSTRWCARRRST